MERFWLSLLATLIGFCLLLYGFRSAAFVNTQNGDKSWVWYDILDNGTFETTSGQFDGWLHVPDSGQLWLENNTGAALTFTIDEHVVYEGTEPAALALDVWHGQVVPFRLDYSLPSDFPPDGHFALSEEGLGRIRYTVPPWSFAPPNAEIGGSNTLTRIARPLSLIILAVAAVLILASLRLSRWQWLALTAIFIVSLAVRYITLAEKFANSPDLWEMTTIWDNFVMMGRGVMSGTFALTGYYPQGNILYMALLQLILGPNVASLYWVQTTIGALVPVLLCLAGWALFSRSAGIAAGLISALYAPLIHFQHTLTLDSGVIVLTALMFLSLIAFYRWQLWLFLTLAGLGIGVMTIFRGTFALIGLWPLLVIALMPMSWRRRLTAAALVAFCALLPVSLPVIENFREGNTWLTPSRSDFQLFRANNQDAIGFNTFKTQSELLAEEQNLSWTEALVIDLQRYPTRAAELTLRRLALFFEATEHSSDDHAAYFTTGLAYSPTLRALSLAEQINFRVICMAAITALVIGWHTRHRRNVWVVAEGIVVFMLSLSFLYVEGRTRIAGALPVLLLAGALPAFAWELRKDKRRLRYLAQAALAVCLLLLAITFIRGNFPAPKVTTPDHLPHSFVPVSATYNDELRLLGYGYYDTDFAADGYVTFELYWQPLRQPAKDYTVTIRLVNTVTREVDDIYNTQLAIQSPTIYSSAWQPGTVYIDRYLITLPDAPTPQAYDLYIGLFDTETQQLLPIADTTAENQDNHLRLTGVSINNEVSTSQFDSLSASAIWGNTLALRSATCALADNLTVNLQWQTLQRPQRPWHFFIHIRDENDTLLDQQDGVLEPDFPLDAWPPGHTTATTATFANIVGPIQIEIGFYDVFSGERWAISQGGNSAENLYDWNCSESQPADE